MNHIPWIPIVERAPEAFQEVIVSQIDEDGELDNYAATYVPGCDHSPPQWMSLIYIKPAIRDWAPAASDVRATDFWLAIPAEPPQHNVVNGGYPA